MLALAEGRGGDKLICIVTGHLQFMDKSVPAKRKKTDGKSVGNVTKAKKSKTQTKDKVVSAGGDDSDSDSSLDEEKWKKLVLQLTDSEIAKMDTINALDSSAQQPKAKRVRKPRAKPPAKTVTPIQQSDGTVEKKEIAKMDTINALDSSAQQPKAKRVRKPRAKPPAKTVTPIQQSDRTAEKKEKGEDKATAEAPTNNSDHKKSSPKKTAPVTSSATASQEQNFNTVEDRPTTSTVSPSKQTPVKEKRKVMTPTYEKNDEPPSEPKKKKKKKKEMTEVKVVENANETGEGGKEKASKVERLKKNEVKVQECVDKSVEEERRMKGQEGDGKSNENEDEMVEKNKTGDADDDNLSEPVVTIKTPKKKKKEKTANEKDSEQISEEVMENTVKKAKKKKKSEVNAEEDTENAEQVVEEKKAKKKKNEAADGEEISEQTVTENKVKKKKRKSPNEENSEQIVEEKKKEKKDKCDQNEMSEQIAEDNMTTESRDGEERPEETPKGKKKKKKDSSLLSNSADMDPLSQPNPETQSPPTEKKKKKSKLKSADVPAASVQDTAATRTLLTPSSDTPKKELCLYTLGNLFPDSDVVKDKLLAQGIIPALANCIENQKHNLAVVEAAAFSLTQLLQAKDAAEKIIPKVLASSLPSQLLSVLNPDPNFGLAPAIECAWCLHYLASSSDGNGELLALGALSHCSSLLMSLGGAVAEGNKEEGMELLVCPLLRCVGNLVSCCPVDSLSTQVGDVRLVAALCALIKAYLHTQPALARESAWVLNNLTELLMGFHLASEDLPNSCVIYIPFWQGALVLNTRVVGNDMPKMEKHRTRTVVYSLMTFTNVMYGNRVAL
ncbi:hypothetical protein F2P81_007624 [Scophthalmus maximus]|uniref:Uncharacterized protein n=1 Tax=Scophthalmus maximus TaxID=52904 RepID=A0A6A4T3F6_SCOMX|nr:hypothetical protein F2P81_007624 [Scophthalmus maximus]